MDIEELKMKVALQETAIALCEESGDHLWGDVYMSKIVVPGQMRPGDSVACVRCGKRVPRNVASQEGQWA